MNTKEQAKLAYEAACALGLEYFTAQALEELKTHTTEVCVEMWYKTGLVMEMKTRLDTVSNRIRDIQAYKVGSMTVWF